MPRCMLLYSLPFAGVGPMPVKNPDKALLIDRDTCFAWWDGMELELSPAQVRVLALAADREPVPMRQALASLGMTRRALQANLNGMRGRTARLGIPLRMAAGDRSLHLIYPAIEFLPFGPIKQLSPPAVTVIRALIDTHPDQVLAALARKLIG